MIAEGASLLQHALANTKIGPYQLQAAIAAVHCEAGSAGETDWRQIVALYTLLERLAPNPVFSLNRAVAVAVAMADGPQAGLVELEALELDPALEAHYRLEAVRGHMRELAGDRSGAQAAYRAAARLTTSMPERRCLESRASQL